MTFETILTITYASLEKRFKIPIYIKNHNNGQFSVLTKKDYLEAIGLDNLATGEYMWVRSHYLQYLNQPYNLFYWSENRFHEDIRKFKKLGFI